MPRPSPGVDNGVSVGATPGLVAGQGVDPLADGSVAAIEAVAAADAAGLELGTVTAQPVRDAARMVTMRPSRIGTDPCRDSALRLHIQAVSPSRRVTTG
jgi:hypothetical protein